MLYLLFVCLIKYFFLKCTVILVKNLFKVSVIVLVLLEAHQPPKYYLYAYNKNSFFLNAQLLHLFKVFIIVLVFLEANQPPKIAIMLKILNP